MATLGRRLISYIASRLNREAEAGGVNDDALAAVVVVVLSCAFITEALGVHALFGAFLAGVVMPKDTSIVRAIEIRLRDVLSVILLPIFFAITGLRLRIGLLADASTWGVCALVILVAVAGKLAGSALAARASRFNWRDALTLGVLMNTRGLMELVVLNIGLDSGIISAQLYAILVIMAITTTLMTAPMLRLLGPPAAP